MSNTEANKPVTGEPQDYCELWGDCNLCTGLNCTCTHHAPVETAGESVGELLPCQHGNPAKMQIKTPYSGASGNTIYFVTCDHLLCPPSFHSTEDAARAAHNTRKPSAAIDEIVERWFASNFGDKVALKSALASITARPAQPVDRDSSYKTLLDRALREGRHGPMCDRARCVCWKAETRAAVKDIQAAAALPVESTLDDSLAAMDEWLESGRMALWRAEIKKYKIRNNARRDEDVPVLREAVDDIYLLLGLMETAITNSSLPVNSQPAELDNAARNLYGVGGELYTFVHTMRMQLLNSPAHPNMSQRAQELLDAIVTHDQEVESIARRITEECKAEIEAEFATQPAVELAAFHRGVDAAKDAIRSEEVRDRFAHLKPQFINAIARKCGVDRGASQPAWQPISSAPKDGRTLLLGYENLSGKWRTVRGQWFSEQEIMDSWEDPDDGIEGWYETSEQADDPPNCWSVHPTHWMPLPAPPEPVSAEDEK